MKRMNAVVIGLLAGCLLAAGAMAETASKDSGKAAGAGTNSLGQKYDTKLPIEISSDKLEVHQHENRAIFTGNVIAVQGKIRLTADTMIVHYRQKSQQGKAADASAPAPAPGANRVGTSAPGAEPATPPAPAPATPGGTAPAAASQPGDMGAISLIEVEGHVFMATPEESATGDKGNYQVDEKLLHLSGDNVTLTRDKNILRGTELVYNLESGESVLTNHGESVTNADGRVHSLFTPQDNKNGKGTKAKKPAGTPAPTPSPAPAPAAPAASGGPAAP